MSKSKISIDLLQLFMAAILVGLGLFLKGNEAFHNVAVLFLSIPGITLVISYFMNFLTYPRHWTFTVIVVLIYLLGDVLYYFRSGFELTPSIIVFSILVVGFTSLIATFFHLLHGDVILKNDKRVR